MSKKENGTKVMEWDIDDGGKKTKSEQIRVKDRRRGIEEKSNERIVYFVKPHKIVYDTDFICAGYGFGVIMFSYVFIMKLNQACAFTAIIMCLNDLCNNELLFESIKYANKYI